MSDHTLRIISTLTNIATLIVITVLLVGMRLENRALKRRFHRIGDDAEKLIQTQENHGDDTDTRP